MLVKVRAEAQNRRRLGWERRHLPRPELLEVDRDVEEHTNLLEPVRLTERDAEAHVPSGSAGTVAGGADGAKRAEVRAPIPGATRTASDKPSCKVPRQARRGAASLLWRDGSVLMWRASLGAKTVVL